MPPSSRAKKKPAETTPVPKPPSRRGLLLATAAGSLGVGVGIGRFLRPSAPAQRDKARPTAAEPEDPTNINAIGHPGPWGRLRYTRVGIEPVREMFEGRDDYQTQTRWFFGDMNLEGVRTVLEQLGLAPAQREQLLVRAPEETETGTWVFPANGTILDLDAQTRTQLYRVLAPYPENRQRYPIALRAPLVEERLRGFDFPMLAIEAFRKLLYGEGLWRFFADVPLVRGLLETPEQQVDFTRMLARNTTFMVTLLIEQGANIAEMASYWGYGGRAKDVRPLLESLARNPGGYELDVAHMLPAFARRRIYTYARPDDELVRGRDCFWTSINFMAENADDTFFDAASFMEKLTAEQDPVDEPTFGDTVVFLDQNQVAVHAASYLADDVVFTKNGGGTIHPWMFMKLESLRELYRGLWLGEALRTVIYRRR